MVTILAEKLLWLWGLLCGQKVLSLTACALKHLCTHQTGGDLLCQSLLYTAVLDGAV